MKRLLLLLALAASSACASSSPPAPIRAAAATSARAAIADASLAELLAQEGFGGVIAVLEDGEPRVRCSDVGRCGERSLPASTFKIVNTLLALETGVATGPEFVIPWDGVVRSYPDWNRDQTLQSAYDVSCVPYFQEIARRIGLDRMRDGVARLGYGNAQVGEVVDRFWLDGPLAISPMEQLDFLERLEAGRLPVSSRTRELAREIMVRERRGEWVLRGKTGWSAPGTPQELGWFVGYATRGERATYVAVRVTRGPEVSDERFRIGRMALAIRALERVGAYGETSPTPP